MTVYICFSWRQRINITLKIPQSKMNNCRLLIAHIVGNFYKPVLTQNIPGFPLVLLRTWDSSHILFFTPPPPPRPCLATARAFYLVLLVSCAQDPVQREGALVSAETGVSSGGKRKGRLKSRIHKLNTYNFAPLTSLGQALVSGFLTFPWPDSFLLLPNDYVSYLRSLLWLMNMLELGGI